MSDVIETMRHFMKLGEKHRMAALKAMLAEMEEVKARGSKEARMMRKQKPGEPTT